MITADNPSPRCVCLYSYNIYHLFTPEQELGTGGSERQLYELGSRLQKRGLEVVYLVGDFGQPDEEWRDGFRFVKALSRDAGHPVRKLRFLWNALSMTKADVFLERGSSEWTFWLSLFSRFHHRVFIFCGASDVNFIREAIDPVFSSRVKRSLYFFGLRHASSIVVQKESQRTLVARTFGKGSTVIRSFLLSSHVGNSVQKASDVIWVGNLIPYKQAEIVFELAEGLKEYRFVMIGGARDRGYFEAMKEKARGHPNLDFLGFIPFKDVESYICRSKILINTTAVNGRFEEGFPNTFLQAWMAAIPVVSLKSDPDRILMRHSIGRCSGSVGKMSLDLREILNDEALRKQMGERGRAYVLGEHDNEKIEGNYITLMAPGSLRRGAI